LPHINSQVVHQQTSAPREPVITVVDHPQCADGQQAVA
jgi:hypothetical protein